MLDLISTRHFLPRS